MLALSLALCDPGCSYARAAGWCTVLDVQFLPNASVLLSFDFVPAEPRLQTQADAGRLLRFFGHALPSVQTVARHGVFVGAQLECLRWQLQNGRPGCPALLYDAPSLEWLS